MQHDGQHEQQNTSSPLIEDNEVSSRIEMATAVAAPISLRPSPPRAIHINGSGNGHASQTGSNNGNTNSNNLRKRVPPPKLTDDEALQADNNSSSNSSTPLAINDQGKDRFAALLALGVAHQQQQQHVNTAAQSNGVQKPVMNARTASSSSTLIRDAGVDVGLMEESQTRLAHQPEHQDPSSSSHSHSQSSLHAENGEAGQRNDRSVIGEVVSLQVLPQGQVGQVETSQYIRPARSDAVLDADANATSTLSSTGAPTATILQQHRMKSIPGQQHSSSSSILPSINFGSSSSPSSSGTGSNPTTSGTTTNKMAALAAKWGNSASQKLHSFGNTLNSNTTSSGGNGGSAATPSSSSGYSSKGVSSGSSTTALERRPHLASNASGSGRDGMVVLSGIAESPSSSSSSVAAGSSSSSLSNGMTVKPSSINPIVPIISRQASSSSSSTTTTTTTASVSHQGSRALGKAVNIASRLRTAAASKLSKESRTNAGYGGGANTEEELSPSASMNNNEEKDTPSNANHPSMTKSSSFRSLSNFGNVIKNSSSSSSSNLRKFSPSSFSSSSSSLLSSSSVVTPTSAVATEGQLGGSNGNSGNAISSGSLKRLGLHRASPSSLSTSLGLTHRSSPLSSSNSLSTSSSSNSQNLGGTNNYNINQNNNNNNGTGHIRHDSINRSFNVRTKNVLGVQVPIGRAGEVFGAPLNVAADRTRLIHGIEDDNAVPLMPGREELSGDEMARRKEACLFLPAIAIRCLDYLNEYGKTEEGLYRIPGSTHQITNLRTIFDAALDLDLLSKLDTRVLEPSAVASCFKLWLRELPESLLHNMEREIDILLLEHTGNAASSKVTMAQAQSSSPSPPNSSKTTTPSTNAEVFASQQQQQPLPHGVAVSSSNGSNSNGMTQASPLVIKRIKDLFANNLPKENVILLREISYHLAHLASFSNVTKMTFSNLRLILSPTLRLSPVMLSLLVNEREQVFPKPGTFLASYRDAAQSIHLNNSTLDLSLPLQSVRETPTIQPKLTLSLPGEDGLPPIPPSKSPIVRYGQGSSSSSTPPTVNLRTPFASIDSNWTSFSSPASSGQNTSSTGNRLSNGSIPGYRASWHVVDLPLAGSGGRKDSGESTRSGLEIDSDGHIATPIAKKFLHQRAASSSNLLDRGGEKGASPASPAPSEAGSRRSVSSNGTSGGSNVLARTPTLTGRSPSPFFSSGAPPAALGFMATHSRKRSSASSFSSIVSNSAGAGGIGMDGTRTALWRARKVSPSSQLEAAASIKINQVKNEENNTSNAQDEEEELSNSDTNTSICSSASSAKTPKDQHDTTDIDTAQAVRIANSNERSALEDEELGDSTSNTLSDSRRATITAESFGQSFARKGQGKNANSEEMRRKRGSVMLMNMPGFA